MVSATTGPLALNTNGDPKAAALDTIETGYAFFLAIPANPGRPEPERFFMGPDILLLAPFSQCYLCWTRQTSELLAQTRQRRPAV
jgi:hypothetical protein